MKKKYKYIIIVLCMLITVCGVLFAIRSTEFQPILPPLEIENIEYEFPTNDAYETMLHALGYREIVLNPMKFLTESELLSVAEKLTVADQNAHLTFTYRGLFLEESEQQTQHTWSLYCAKSEGVKLLPEILIPENHVVEELDFFETYPDLDTGIFQAREYDIVDKNTENTRTTIVYAIYYSETQNLYNLVRTFENPYVENIIYPCVFWENKEDVELYTTLNPQFYMSDGFPIEMADFVMQTNGQKKTYSYRVGMTLGMWASTRLTNGDWTLGLGNTMCSSDFKYGTADVNTDIRHLVDENGVITIDAIDKVDVHLEEAMKQNMAYFLTPTSLVHTVKWDTPLFTPGIQINTQHSNLSHFAMSDQTYIIEPHENVVIRLQNVTNKMLKDVKLYAFKEPYAFVDSLMQGKGYLDHLTPLPVDSEYIKIPEDARAIDFIDCVNESNINETHSLYGGTVEAAWVLNQEANFDAANPNVFAITYKDTIVYWIHIPIYSGNHTDIDYSKIQIVPTGDGYDIQSDIYDEEVLSQIREMLDTNPTLLESLINKTERPPLEIIVKDGEIQDLPENMEIIFDNPEEVEEWLGKTQENP